MSDLEDYIWLRDLPTPDDEVDEGLAEIGLELGLNRRYSED